jgi:hypothetical protein
VQTRNGLSHLADRTGAAAEFFDSPPNFELDLVCDNSYVQKGNRNPILCSEEVILLLRSTLGDGQTWTLALPLCACMSGRQSLKHPIESASVLQLTNKPRSEGLNRVTIMNMSHDTCASACANFPLAAESGETGRDEMWVRSSCTYLDCCAEFCD